MRSLDEIKSELRSDEQILWQQIRITNQLKDLRSNILFLIVMVTMFLFSILLYLYPILFPLKFELVLIIALIVLFPSMVPLFFLFGTIRSLFKMKKKLNVKIREFHKYEEFAILTNNRWIQKLLDFERYGFSDYSSPLILFRDDVAIVNLNDIDVIYTSPYKKTNKYRVHLYVEYEETPLDKVFWVVIEREEYQMLMCHLQSLLHFTSEEHVVFREGDSVFHCKKK